MERLKCRLDLVRMIDRHDINNTCLLVLHHAANVVELGGGIGFPSQLNVDDFIEVDVRIIVAKILTTLLQFLLLSVTITLLL